MELYRNKSEQELIMDACRLHLKSLFFSIICEVKRIDHCYLSFSPFDYLNPLQSLQGTPLPSLQTSSITNLSPFTHFLNISFLEFLIINREGI